LRAGKNVKVSATAIGSWINTAGQCFAKSELPSKRSVSTIPTVEDGGVAVSNDLERTSGGEETKGVPSPRKPIVPLTKIDVLALDQVIASARDPKERAKHRELETVLSNDVRRNAAAISGPHPSKLVESLAFTVALCEHDLRSRQALDGPLTNNVEGQQNLDRAMRRYLAACRTLAMVRNLNLPNIQVNIAEQQVVANG
jgi:hypothetical protein